MDLSRVVISVLIMAAVTAFTRFLPFLFFGKKKLPPVVMYAQRYTPPVIMTVLVIYSLSGVGWAEPPHGIPELIGVAAVAALHLWKRNPMISIFGGTILYMVLVQTDIMGRFFS